MWLCATNESRSIKGLCQKVGGTKIVNIVSYNIKATVHDSKDSFLYFVRKRKVRMNLQADIAQ